jgi:hypothetical protein
MALASIDISTPPPARAHIPCGLQAGVPEDAHGICALAGFKYRTYAKLLQLGAPPKTVHWYGKASATTLGRFCVSPKIFRR